MKAIHVLVVACTTVLLLSCENDGLDNRVNYLYSGETLDARTLSVKQEIIDAGYKDATSQAAMEQYFQSLKNLEYEDYDGSLPEYEFKLDTSSFLDGKGFKTIKVNVSDAPAYNVMYVHGGAYTFPISEEHLAFVEDIAGRIHANVYVPLYPMLPRWNHSDAYEMLLDVYVRLLQQGNPVILMGDSAGGNIVIGFTFYLKSLGYKLPAILVGISPALDMSLSNPLADKLDGKDIYIDKTCFAAISPRWSDGLSLEDPAISPLYGNPAGFPPTLMFIGDQEILYPDVLDFAEKCASCNVRTTVYIGRGLWHVAPLSDIPVSEEFKECVESFVYKK